MKILEPIMQTPSNGEEELVYYPDIAKINRKTMDCLFRTSGPEAYLNDEASRKKNNDGFKITVFTIHH